MRRRKPSFFSRLITLVIIIGLITAAGNFYLVNEVEDRIYQPDKVEDLPEADCVMALGALVKDGEQLSLVLRDRVQKAVDVYKAGKAKKILLSGDHENDDYDEVGAMLSYCLAEDVPAEDIFCDHYGLSTYDSIIRAKEIFEVDTMIISTQKFHLARALYIADGADIDAYGIIANREDYSLLHKIGSPARESIARMKDLLMVNVIKPKAKYLREAIPITGNGKATHERPENQSAGEI